MTTSTTPIEITEEEYLEAVEDNAGFCTVCEEFTGDFAEPDARHYLCECCGQRTVFGAEQALIEGLITF